METPRLKEFRWLSATMKRLRFLPACRLTSCPTRVCEHRQKMWNSWVKGKGVSYLQPRRTRNQCPSLFAKSWQLVQTNMSSDNAWTLSGLAVWEKPSMLTPQLMYFLLAGKYFRDLRGMGAAMAYNSVLHSWGSQWTRTGEHIYA
jgi:hypothetical protein